MNGEEFRKRLLPAAGGHPEDQVEHQLTDILLQISLAVMLVFMIAVFLFIEKTGGELSKAEDLKKKVSEAKSERLAEAVRHTADNYRIRYGLPEFLRLDPDTGAKSYRFEKLLQNGKMTDDQGVMRSFCAGGKNAWEDYREPEALTKQWRHAALNYAGMTEEDLTAEEKSYLSEQIRSAQLMLHEEVEEVQTYAAALLQEWYALHPEKIREPQVQSVLQRTEHADPATRDLLMKELTSLLKRHAFRELEKISGVPVLKGTK